MIDIKQAAPVRLQPIARAQAPVLGKSMRLDQAGLGELARAADLGDIADRVFAAERLSPEDGLRLYQSPHLHVVGALANFVRERLHGDVAYFNVNLHINYTNFCNKFCRFCSFDRLPGQDGAYQMTPEQVGERILSIGDLPVTEVHLSLIHI